MYRIFDCGRRERHLDLTNSGAGPADTNRFPTTRTLVWLLMADQLSPMLQNIGVLHPLYFILLNFFQFSLLIPHCPLPIPIRPPLIPIWGPSESHSGSLPFLLQISSKYNSFIIIKAPNMVLPVTWYKNHHSDHSVVFIVQITTNERSFQFWNNPTINVRWPNQPIMAPVYVYMFCNTWQWNFT